MTAIFRQFIAICAIFSMVSLGVVHGKLASDNIGGHDASECSVCLYQTNSDLHDAASANILVAQAPYKESILALNAISLRPIFVGYFNSRAPPVSA